MGNIQPCVSHPLITEFLQTHKADDLTPQIQTAFTPEICHSSKDAKTVEWLLKKLVEDDKVHLLKHCFIAESPFPEINKLSDADRSLLHWLRTGKPQICSSVTRRNIIEDAPWWTMCNAEYSGQFYNLPKGTDVYHSTHGGIAATEILERGNYFGDRMMVTLFFGMDYAANHQNGGVVHKYQTTENVRLLAMDNADNILWLHALLQNTDDQRALQHAYPCIAKRVRRRYGSRIDVVLMQNICKLVGVYNRFGCMIHGTATKDMQEELTNRGGINTSPEKNVPPELYLCNPKSVLIYQESFRVEITDRKGKPQLVSIPS